MQDNINKENNGEELEALEDYVKELEKEIEYEVKSDYVLRHKTTDEKFKFTNQAEYEKISNYVQNYLQLELLSKFNLKLLWVPRKITRNTNSLYTRAADISQCHIYVSDDFFTNTERLLCLVQGTGCVRAGMWSRSVCINESLELGSVIPFVEDAYKNHMSVIIFNPNERKDSSNGKKIEEFNRMETHCQWVYQNIVKPFSLAKEIYFVSHSMGGLCTIDILKACEADLNSGLIKKIAFTDSVHGSRFRILDNATYSSLAKNSINFVTSHLKAGKLIKSFNYAYDGVYNLSAGHSKHEYTSGSARNEIFKFFFDENYLSRKIKKYRGESDEEQ